jgi:uracil-DNA glycosylase
MPKMPYTINEINLEENWKQLLSSEIASGGFSLLMDMLKNEQMQHKIYPEKDLIFNAFNKVAFENIQVVILGQDPYHGPGQAQGLCFSVADGIKTPPSLANIYKELQSDIGIGMPLTGNLEPWAKQGVFLLNASLTVREGLPNVHQKHWAPFTDSVIKKISELKHGVVFLLWGKFAQKKEQLIDSSKHHILKAAHPSPFSAHNGFLGCKHFSSTNTILKNQGKKEIQWAL